MTDFPADDLTGSDDRAVPSVSTAERLAPRPGTNGTNGHDANGHGTTGNGGRAGTTNGVGHAPVSSEAIATATIDGIDGIRVVRRGARVVERPRPGRMAGSARARELAVAPRPPLPKPTPTPTAVQGRVHVDWRHALLAGLACFAVWVLLDAPTLLRSAQAGPLGVRRTVAVAVLRPLARASDALGLSHVVSTADRAIGHAGYTGAGVLQVVGPPSRGHRVSPRHRAAPRPATAPRSTTPVTAPDGLVPLPPPTAAAPLRVLVVGDSLGIDVGQPLVNNLVATGVVTAVLDGHIDTGLARPDYFDWPAELQGDLARYRPEAVVVFIGANDPQNFIDNGTALSFGSPAWSAAYAKRVGAFMQAVTATGARVLWVGMPPMADPVLNAKMQALNTVFEGQAASHRGVTFFSSWPVLSDPQGRFATFLPDASGDEVQVREPDGTHIAASGAQRLSQAAVAEMDHAWGINP